MAVKDAMLADLSGELERLRARLADAEQGRTVSEAAVEHADDERALLEDEVAALRSDLVEFEQRLEASAEAEAHFRGVLSHLKSQAAAAAALSSPSPGGGSAMGGGGATPTSSTSRASSVNEELRARTSPSGGNSRGAKVSRINRSEAARTKGSTRHRATFDPLILLSMLKIMR